LFRYGKSIVDLDAKISDGALDLGMPEQKTDQLLIARHWTVRKQSASQKVAA
jgi:hypothetical protein